MIRTLDAFSVAFAYRRRETTWLVHAPGQDAPVARVHKAAAPDSREPYQVYGGPQLDELLGLLSGRRALAADGSRIGEVTWAGRNGLRGGLLADEKWTCVQDGLGELDGRPVGLGSRARHAYVVGSLLDNGLTDLLLDHSLRYRDESSEGFEFSRRSGVRSRYDVRVHDPRVNRLLVLAAVGRFESEHGTADVRTLLPSIDGLFRR